MSEMTNQIVSAFLDGKSFKKGGSHTDGRTLYHLNKPIARFTPDGLQMHAPEQTRVIMNRLNGLLARVDRPLIVQKDFEWYVEGKLWDGAWRNIN